MPPLEQIEAIDKRLVMPADMRWANSCYTTNQHFVPCIQVFLFYAYSRFLNKKGAIDADLPRRGGKPRAFTTDDVSQKTSFFVNLEAQFDFLLSPPDNEIQATKDIEATVSIEKDYTSLQGVLPISEQFADRSRKVLRQVGIFREQEEEQFLTRALPLPQNRNEEVAG